MGSVKIYYCNCYRQPSIEREMSPNTSPSDSRLNILAVAPPKLTRIHQKKYVCNSLRLSLLGRLHLFFHGYLGLLHYRKLDDCPWWGWVCGAD